MNYYEHHIGDYDKATAHLTACEDGIYGRLIRRYYDTEEPLPIDLKVVQRFVRARSRDEKNAVKNMLEEFFVLCDDGWRHARCDEEIDRYKAKRIKAQASANARWNGCERNANGSANAMRTHSGGNAHQTPDTRHQSSTDRSPPPPESASPLGAVGVFEDHDVPRATPNPVAPLAIALNAKGVRCTAMNPDLIAAHAEGVTPEHLTALTELPEFQGKPATYVIRAARREHAERAAPISTGPPRQQPMGKTATAIAILEQSKRERQQQRLADGRDRDGNPEAPVLIARSHTGS